MKATLEFDIENPDDNIREKEIEKERCARKGYEMSGFVDKVLDYLLVIAPHIPMNEVYDKIKDMYMSYLEEFDIVDMCEEDLQEVINTYHFYTGEFEDEAEDQLQKLRKEYIEKMLTKDRETQMDLYKKLKYKFEEEEKRGALKNEV